MNLRLSKTLALSGVVAIGVLIATGCSPSVRWPNLFHPGPAGYQRAVAEKYDPYPSPDAGPEIVGGRPLGYQRPLNDVEWSRRYARPQAVGQPMPLPPVASAPAPVFAAPQYSPAPMATVPQSVPFQQTRSPY